MYPATPHRRLILDIRLKLALGVVALTATTGVSVVDCGLDAFILHNTASASVQQLQGALLVNYFV